MKRITLIIIPLVFILGACSSQNPISSSSTSNKTSETTSIASTSESGETSTTSSEDKFYLPSSVVTKNITTSTNSSTIEYVYDIDFLGYKQTTTNEESKSIKTYRYNDDFSSLVIEEIDYEIDDGIEKLTDMSKNEYTYYENGSYKMRNYIKGVDEEEYVFMSETYKKYNEAGQKILNYVLHENPDIPGQYYYSQYEVYEYDSLGYPTHFECYDYDSSPQREKYLYSYTDYIYEGDGRTSCVAHDYYLEDNVFIEDSYTNIQYIIEDDILYSKQQIYYMDGTQGNYNEFGYVDNWRRVYANYGGLNEVSRIKINQYDQITDFDYSLDEENIKAVAIYDDNGGPILNTSYIVDSKSYPYAVNASYVYDDNGQLSEAEGIYSYSNIYTSLGEEEIYYVEVNYSELQNDTLHEKLDYVQKIVRTFSTRELIEGI